MSGKGKSMKKGQRIGISISVGVCVFAVLTGIVTAGKKDDKKAVMDGLQDFFTISEESLVNNYLGISDFQESFYEKDMSVTGEFYTEVAGNTVKVGAEGVLDKSERLVSVNLDIGLGGMPFATVQGYSDDKYLYGTSEVFGDRILKLDYKENLYDLGAHAGIDRRNVMMAQKAYIEVFNHLVSTEPYEKWKDILENEMVKSSLLEIYDTMTVELQKSAESEEGFSYYIQLKSPEVKELLESLRQEFPHLEEQGYLEILEKFISEENGIEILEQINKEGKTEKVKIYNSDNGYEMIFGRTEQEKGDHNGFDSMLSIKLLHGEEVILDGEVTCSYNAEEKYLEVKGKEAQNQIEVSLTGNVFSDQKDNEISLEIQEFTGVWKQRDITMNGKTEVTFGEYQVTLPEGEAFSLIEKEEQELNQLGNDVLKEVRGILGSEKYDQLLEKLGF